MKNEKWGFKIYCIFFLYPALLQGRTYTTDMASEELIRQSEWNKSYLQNLIIKRATVILIFFGMFVIGIIIRIACPPPAENDSDAGILTTEKTFNVTTDSMLGNLNFTPTTEASI